MYLFLARNLTFDPVVFPWSEVMIDKRAVWQAFDNRRIPVNTQNLRAIALFLQHGAGGTCLSGRLAVCLYPLGLHLCFGNKRRRHISSLNMRNKVIVMFITSKRFPTNRTKGTILRANNGWIRVITVIRRRHKRIVYNTEPKPHPYIKNKHTKKELPK